MCWYKRYAKCVVGRSSRGSFRTRLTASSGPDGFATCILQKTDHLPSKHDLMPGVGVGRPSVREAFLASDEIGLVEVN